MFCKLWFLLFFIFASCASLSGLNLPECKKKLPEIVSPLKTWGCEKQQPQRYRPVKGMSSATFIYHCTFGGIFIHVMHKPDKHRIGYVLEQENVTYRGECISERNGTEYIFKIYEEEYNVYRR